MSKESSPWPGSGPNRSKLKRNGKWSDPFQFLPERKKEPQEYHSQYSQGSLVIPYYFLFISAVLRGQSGGDGVSRHINCAHPSQNSLAVPRILARDFSRPHPSWAPFSPLFIYRAKPSKKIFSGDPHAARVPRPPRARHLAARLWPAMQGLFLPVRLLFLDF